LCSHARPKAIASYQNVSLLDPAAGKLNTDPTLILIDVLKITAEMVMRIIDGRAQKALHPIPGRHGLPEWAFVDYTS
jgi:hypothetical protein